jgi:ABC-type transport system involved in multi-copper enzyme maturation permease subunit
MVGPVLHQELLLGSRRNRLHAFRWVYAGWLVTQVLYFYLAFQAEELARVSRARFWTSTPEVVNRASAPEVVGGRFADMFVRQQMLLLLLVIPALVAGAITDEKRRGTLQYLIVSDLDARHVVLGKLLGRLAQVFLLMLAGLPLFALLAGFGGVAPVSMLFVPVVLIVPVFGVAAAALLASVLCRQTRDAVLGLYAVGIAAGLVVWLVGGVLNYFDPLYVLAPAWGAPGSLDLAEAGRRLALSSVGWGALGCACVGLSVWQMRPAYVRELESIRPTRPTWYSEDRPPVDDEPVRWRERNVEGLAPNPALRRVPQWLGITLVALATVVSSLTILAVSLPTGIRAEDLLRPLLHLNLDRLKLQLPNATLGFQLQGIAVMLLASLVVGIRCSGAVTNEREKQTWEALLLTPLSAKQIIRGKMWGIMGASYWYLLAYACPAVVLSALGGQGTLEALLWTLLWLAVTVLAMYFIGATGLWRSVQAANSWRALLATLGVGYVGGIVIYLVTSPVILILSLLLLLMLLFIDLAVGTQMAKACVNNFNTYFKVFLVSSGIGLALIFFLMARLFLNRAQRWVADRERTRHWHDEPRYRRPRLDRPMPRLTRGG